MSEAKYDFDFICGALGLVVHNERAFNPAQVIKITRDGEGFYVVYLAGEYDPLHFAPEEMAELEANIRKRQDEVKKNQYEAMKEQIRQQAMAVEELNSAPRPAHGIPIIGGNKRRQ